MTVSAPAELRGALLQVRGHVKPGASMLLSELIWWVANLGTLYKLNTVSSRRANFTLNKRMSLLVPVNFLPTRTTCGSNPMCMSASNARPRRSRFIQSPRLFQVCVHRQ